MQRQTDGRRRTRLFSVPIRTVGALALLLGLMLGWTSGGSTARAVLARTHTGPPYGGQTSTMTLTAGRQVNALLIRGNNLTLTGGFALIVGNGNAGTLAASGTGNLISSGIDFGAPDSSA